MEKADDGTSFESCLTQQTPATPTPLCRLWLRFLFEATTWAHSRKLCRSSLTLLTPDHSASLAFLSID